MRHLPAIVAALLLTFSSPAWCANKTSNVDIATRVFLEKLGKGKFEETRPLYAPDFVAHGANESYSLEQDEQSARNWRNAFPDLIVTIERTVGHGDLVAVHWRMRGTNTIASGGMPGRSAKVNVQGMTFFRFARGKITEEWSLIDVATLMTQLGQ